jgi:solute carrier family 35 protein
MPPTNISLSVLLVVAGCVVAGLGDLSFDPLGYAYALLSCATQSGYLLLVEFQVSRGLGAGCTGLAQGLLLLLLLLVVLLVLVSGWWRCNHLANLSWRPRSVVVTGVV